VETVNANKYKPLIVVIDDDEAARVSISQMLRLRGYSVETFDSAESALCWSKLEKADCIITDVKMPGMDGETFLKEFLKQGYISPVVMITGHGDIAMAVRCLKAGAYDFVEKPFEDEVLIACVARAVEKMYLTRESTELKKRLQSITLVENGRFGMVGKSPSMQALYQQIEVVARSKAPVLIVGETGTGKELVAHAIHELSQTKDGPFIAVNAGALPETMLESELFGHAKGAFTGAHTSRDGKLVSASGGSLFLDEIESLSLKAQVELLRVLEDGLVHPLGSDTPKNVNIRLIASTKVDLKEEVKKGKLREDFYHRIMVLTVIVPPLRERVEDIPLLISYFLKEAAKRNEIPVPRVKENTLAKMLQYRWPGNVRELKNAVERMVITAYNGIAGSFSTEEDISESRLLSIPSGNGKLKIFLERTEKKVIEEILRENNGEISKTSTVLGISRRALYERMKKYGFNKEDFQH